MDSKRKYQIMIILLAAVIVCGGGYWIYTYFRTAPDTGGSAYVDPNASAWDDGLDGPEEIEEKILIPGYSGAQMNTGDKELKPEYRQLKRE